MSENTPPRQWPPRRRHHRVSSGALSDVGACEDLESLPQEGLQSPKTPQIPLPPLLDGSVSAATPSSPLIDSINRKRKSFRNGYEEAPKPPSYRPYTPQNSGRKRLRLAGSDVPGPRLPLPCPLSEPQWNELAAESGIIPNGSALKPFQMQCANAVVMQQRDVCVIAPTGAGKSLLWCLPLLAVRDWVSLVITPYTSLGIEGEARTTAAGLPSVFVHSEQKGQDILEKVVQGFYRVVFVCVEMLESPSFALVLHTKSFRARLSAVYLDEAHLLYETFHWRTAYSRLLDLRPIIGHDVPLIPISATLPAVYREALYVHAGLKRNAAIINLGNYRPELSTVVLRLEHPVSSFLDLSFVLPWGSKADDILKTIVYCDDLELLTAMFWWFHSRLASMGLPVAFVDILHAGLSSDHEKLAIKDFSNGHSRILLGSEKIGAGLNFPNVRRVVNYLVRKKLTLAKYRQREGRGGRTPGTTSTGYLIAESELFDEEADHRDIDPGLLELIRTSDCLDNIVDKWLENPPRPPSLLPRHCCSNCYPTLKPSRELRFVMFDPSHLTSGTAFSAEEKRSIYAELVDWRMRMWRAQWRQLWDEFGPADLISDADLKNVAKHAASLTSVDDLRSLTQLFYWEELSTPLYTAVCTIVAEQKLKEDIEEKLLDKDQDSDKEGQSNEKAVRKPRKAKAETLSIGEQVISLID